MTNIFLHTAFQQRLLPAVTFNKISDAIPVAEAFLRGGLNTIEIPFRTTVAAECITIISSKFSEMHVGAGTILNVTQLQHAIDAGASFALAPSLNTVVCKKATQKKFDFIPGVMTPSEIDIAYSLGYNLLKLFPAEQIGGTAFLKAIQSPYDHLSLSFIPMGGVGESNMQDYLSQKNVIAVGGSWLASQDLIEKKDYKSITRLVKAALLKTK